MFGGLFSMLKLVGNAGKIQSEMAALQQRTAQLTAEGDAGAGMVKVKVDGRMLIVAITISDEALKSGDKEMLEDLIRAAANQAVEKVRVLIAEETTKMATNLGLPPGMNLPLPGLS
jgi:DNA-binding YbaB/EbfC family protein